MPALSPDIPVNEVSIHTIFPTFESRWEALINKDPRAATAFLYCVKSTHIYCRPTCTARLARRKNVVFYDTVDEAEEAGFRPCKRCKPRLPLHETHHAMIRQSCKILDESPDSLPALKDLAKSVGLTQWHFHRIFRRFTDITPRMYWEGRHNPEKQLKYQIDFPALLQKLDGYSGEDPVNNRGEVPKRRLSDPVLPSTPGGLPENILLEAIKNHQNPILSGNQGQQYSGARLEDASISQSSPSFDPQTKLPAYNMNWPNDSNKSNPHQTQHHDGILNPSLNGSNGSLRSLDVRSRASQLGVTNSPHSSTPASASSTPLFSAFGTNNNNLTTQRSRPLSLNAAAARSNAVPPIFNATGFSMSNISMPSNASPAFSNNSLTSSPENLLATNGNGSPSLPSSGDLPAFSPLGGSVPSESNESKSLIGQTSVFDGMSFNPADLDSIDNLETLDSLDNVELSNLDNQMNKINSDSGNRGVNDNLSNNNTHINRNVALNHKPFSKPPHPPLNRHVIHQKNPHTMSSTAHAQISKASQLNKSQKSQQRATQRSLAAWPQSPALLAQQSPSLFPLSPALMAQASPLLFPQSPSLNGLQSPALVGLQSPGLHGLQSPSLAPVKELKEDSPPSNKFKVELIGRQNSNPSIQPLSAPSPISLTQTSPGLQGISDQRSPNFSGQSDKSNGAVPKGNPVARTPQQQLHQHLYRQVQGKPPQKNPQPHRTVTNTLDRKSLPSHVSGIPTSFGSLNTPGSSSPNSASSGSPITGPQQQWRKSATGSNNSSPGMSGLGTVNGKSAESASATPAVNVSQAGGYSSISKSNDTSDLDAWLNGSVLKNLEGIKTGNSGTSASQTSSSAPAKRPLMSRSTSSPVWLHSTNPAASMDQFNQGHINSPFVQNAQLPTEPKSNNSEKSANVNGSNGILGPIDFLSGAGNNNSSKDNKSGDKSDTSNLNLWNGISELDVLGNMNNLMDLDVDISNMQEFGGLDGIVDDLSNFSNSSAHFSSATDTSSMTSDFGNQFGLDSNSNTVPFDFGNLSNNNSNNNSGSGNANGGNFGNLSELAASVGMDFRNDTDMRMDGLDTLLQNKEYNALANQRPSTVNLASLQNSSQQQPQQQQQQQHHQANINTSSARLDESILLQLQQLRQRAAPEIRNQLDHQLQTTYQNQLLQLLMQHKQNQLLQQQQQLRAMLQNGQQQNQNQNQNQQQQRQQQQQTDLNPSLQSSNGQTPLIIKNEDDCNMMDIDEQDARNQFESFLLQ